jgi:hypothetical protein
MVKYSELLSYFRKGLRNGNWHRLSHRRKGLYRAVLIYTNVRGEIVNSKLAAMVLSIVEKLRKTRGAQIFKVGLEKAKRILSTYGKNGVFEWCPQLKEWLRDPDYIFWLGLSASKGIRHPLSRHGHDETET